MSIRGMGIIIMGITLRIISIQGIMELPMVEGRFSLIPQTISLQEQYHISSNIKTHSNSTIPRNSSPVSHLKTSNSLLAHSITLIACNFPNNPNPNFPNPNNPSHNSNSPSTNNPSLSSPACRDVRASNEKSLDTSLKNSLRKRTNPKPLKSVAKSIS